MVLRELPVAINKALQNVRYTVCIRIKYSKTFYAFFVRRKFNPSRTNPKI